MADTSIDTTRLDDLRGSISADDFRTLMTLFAADLGNRLAALARAHGSLDRVRLGKEAHQIAGAAANMGAVTLAGLARRLEDSAATAAPEALGASLAEIATLAAEVLAALERLAADRR